MRRSLAASATAFGALAVLAAVLLRPRPEPEERPFFALRRLVPDTLVVAFPPDTTVLVPGGRTGWRMARPVADDADALVVEALLKRLRDLPVGRHFPIPDDGLDPYGFRAPRGFVRAAWADGTPPDSLIVGGFTLDGAWDYVRAGGGNEVALVAASLTRQVLLRDPFGFRLTRLLPFHESRVTAFETAGAGHRVRLERGEGGWRLAGEAGGPAEPERVDNVLSALAHMEVAAFAADSGGDARATGLDPPRASARIVLVDGETLELRTGEAVPGTDRVHARTSGRAQRLLVSDRYPPVLEHDASWYRRRAVVSFGVGDIESVLVEDGAGARRWARRDWTGDDDDAVRVRGALEAWVSLRATRFEETRTARAFPEGGWELRVTLRGVGRLLAVVEVGPVEGGERPLRIGSGDAARPAEILWIPGAAAPDFRETPGGSPVE